MRVWIDGWARLVMLSVFEELLDRGIHPDSMEISSWTFRCQINGSRPGVFAQPHVLQGREVILNKVSSAPADQRGN